MKHSHEINELLDSITLDNIDDAMYFYSYLLEKIVSKKNKYEQNEKVLIRALKNMDIASELEKLKLEDSSTSDEETD